MSNWRARTSTASLAGACVFAVVSGAGAVFVGNWWGEHHGPVVVQTVEPSTSSSAHPAKAGKALPGGAPARSQPANTADRVAGQADAARARSTAGTGTTRDQTGAAPRPAATRPRPAHSPTAVKSTAPGSKPTSSDPTSPATEPPTSPADPGGTRGPANGSNGGNNGNGVNSQ